MHTAFVVQCIIKNVEKNVKGVNPLSTSRFQRFSSLRSKRFRAVSEQRKTEERDSRF